MSEQNDNKPPEGTPEANEGNPLHQDFINSAPEDLRDSAEKLVPVWDKYVQDQFQTHARYKPLAEVSDEELNDFLQYRERITAGQTDEEKAQAAKEWWNDYGAQLKENYPDLFEEEEPSYNGGISDDDDISQHPMFQQMSTRLQQLEEKDAAAETAARQAQAADFVQGELDKIKPEFGNIKEDDWDQVKDDICALASRYDVRESDVIQKGYADFQRIVNNTERTLFDKKLAHPKPAERGGTTEAHTGPPLNYEDAGDAAKMRIREAMKHGS